ncbi:MAG: hypothetical protein ACKOFI_04360, partial [Phycisphaerales bacterium]
MDAAPPAARMASAIRAHVAQSVATSCHDAPAASIDCMQRSVPRANGWSLKAATSMGERSVSRTAPRGARGGAAGAGSPARAATRAARRAAHPSHWRSARRVSRTSNATPRVGTRMPLSGSVRSPTTIAMRAPRFDHMASS